jgi:hypothetical protein
MALFVNSDVMGSTSGLVSYTEPNDAMMPTVQIFFTTFLIMHRIRVITPNLFLILTKANVKAKVSQV